MALRLRYPLVLASGSPRRANLLAQAGLRFHQVHPSVSERNAPNSLPDHVLELALRKGRAVAAHSELATAVVLSADTVVVHRGSILGKPRNEEEARGMLEALSGTWHEVHTGFALIAPNGSQRVRAVVTKVHFRHLRPEELRHYLATREWVDKAGAYGIQEGAAGFVDRLEGSYTNVVGLPLAEVLEALWDLDLLVDGEP